MNNITVDGSSFNNSFGLGGQPGDRTGVAPISLEAIEQMQVNVAPFDVRQGSFIGAGVNTVTRSGANRLSGSFYHRFRNQDWVGTEAKGADVQPRHLQVPQHRRLGVRPDRQEQVVRVRQLRERARHAAAVDLARQQRRRADRRQRDARARVRPDHAERSSCKTNFDYDTGAFNDLPDETPAKRFLLRSDYNLNNSQQDQLPLQPPDSFTDVGMSNSTSALRGPQRRQHELPELPEHQLQDSREHPVGHRRMELGHRQLMANTLQAGYT